MLNASSSEGGSAASDRREDAGKVRGNGSVGAWGARISAPLERHEQATAAKMRLPWGWGQNTPIETGNPSVRFLRPRIRSRFCLLEHLDCSVAARRWRGSEIRTIPTKSWVGVLAWARGFNRGTPLQNDWSAVKGNSGPHRFGSCSIAQSGRAYAIKRNPPRSQNRDPSDF